MLKQLRPYYEVVGVDASEPMLAVAARKLPGVRLVHGDMTRVTLGERFDVVLCAFDSINHLLRFEEWEAAFDRAHEHLDERGIFVFDVNTEHQLATFVAGPPWTHWFGDDNLLVMDVVEGGDGASIWSIHVFEHVGGHRYRLHMENIREVAFPAERIKASLLERFRQVRVYDAERSRPSARSRRLHFVCRR